MLIGVIGAMTEEVDSLKKEMFIETEFSKAGMSYSKGKLWDRDAVVVVSGIGKVNAAICTQILIDEFDVDVIINVGVAGGVGPDINPGDVVVGTSLLQHDMDATRFGYDLGQIPRMDVFDFKSDPRLVDAALAADFDDISITGGIIVTGDQFVACPEKADSLVKLFGAKATEMEGASIAQTAYLNKKPFIVVRSISDNASTGASVEYNTFVNMAVENSLKMIKLLFQKI